MDTTRIEIIARPQYLTREQVHRLIDAAKTGRDRLFIRVAWETGARVSEILALNRVDLDIAKPFAEIRFGPPARQVPIGESLRDALREDDQFQSPTGKPFIFNRHTAWRIVRDAGRAAGLVPALADGELERGRDVTPDALRHSFAMHCVLEGVPLEIVQQVMGITPAQAAKYGTAAAVPSRVREFLRKVEF
jgi:integrase/recombinase XerD